MKNKYEPFAFYANGAYYDTAKAAIKDGAEEITALYDNKHIPTYSDIFDCLKQYYEVDDDASVNEIFGQSHDKIDDIAQALKLLGIPDED